jgi:hypothetical protein
MHGDSVPLHEYEPQNENKVVFITHNQSTDITTVRKAGNPLPAADVTGNVMNRSPGFLRIARDGEGAGRAALTAAATGTAPEHEFLTATTVRRSVVPVDTAHQRQLRQCILLENPPNYAGLFQNLIFKF